MTLAPDLEVGVLRLEDSGAIPIPSPVALCQGNARSLCEVRRGGVRLNRLVLPHWSPRLISKTGPQSYLQCQPFIAY